MAAPRKDNIKEKILQATTELLKTTALADISLAEIAAAAGISKGTLYYHYKTKNEVFLDITQRFLDEQWEDLIRWTENKEKDTSLNRPGAVCSGAGYCLCRTGACSCWRKPSWAMRRCGRT